MELIHPTALIDSGARIGDGVKIGPYSSIGAEVELGDGVELISHAVVTGRTRLGVGTTVYPFASVGHQPQDMKYDGEPSSLEIGENNVIREHVTINPGTAAGDMVTRIGDGCLFMVGAHVAHDCTIGDHVVMANNATLGGHVKIGEWAIIGGMSAIHQYVRIGRHAIVGGMTGVEHDVIPYGSVVGDRGRLAGLNLIGLKRRGFSRDTIHDLRRAFRLLFADEGTMTERVSDVSELFIENEPVMDIVNFIQVESSRPICQPKMDGAD
jgi:UDP-N-acetylglucosamine acyltransferase